MKSSEILKAAKDKIGTPERWTKNTGARDSRNVPCNPSERNAVCWCSLGAVSCVTGNLYDFHKAATLLDEVLLEYAVPTFNDHPSTTHADVMALFDKAIAAAIANDD